MEPNRNHGTNWGRFGIVVFRTDLCYSDLVVAPDCQNERNEQKFSFKVSEMSQNRLNWVGIDLTSVPAKLGVPGTSRTVTKEVYWSASDPLISIWSFHCHGPRLSRGPCARGSQHEVAVCAYCMHC